MSHAAQAKRFNPHIHGLRGLAALMVFVYHVWLVGVQTGTFPANWTWLGEAFATGRYGVELFFMISGYLITETLIRKHSIARFLEDRALRIYPAFIGVLLPLCAVGMITHSQMFASAPAWSWPLHIVSNLLFLPGVFDLPIVLAVAWSLSFEFAFYLTAAGAFALDRRGLRPAAVALAALVGFVLFARVPSVIFFYAGVAIYLYRDSLLPQRWMRALPPLPCLVLMLALWHWVIVDYSRAQVALNAGYAAGIALAFIAGLLFFDAIVQGRGLIARLMRSRALQFSGTISYSFYLWHAVAMYPVKYLLIPVLLSHLGPLATLLVFAFVSLMLACVLSYLSCQLLEVRLREWLVTRIRARGPADVPLTPNA